MNYITFIKTLSFLWVRRSRMHLSVGSGLWIVLRKHHISGFLHFYFAMDPFEGLTKPMDLFSIKCIEMYKIQIDLLNLTNTFGFFFMFCWPAFQYNDSLFYQLDAQFLYFNTLIIFLYMFRALLCSSSGGQIVLVQLLVSSHWKQVSGKFFFRVTVPDAVLIQFVLLKMSKIVLETCRGK